MPLTGRAAADPEPGGATSTSPVPSASAPVTAQVRRGRARRVEFADRGHSLTIDHGWGEVADACLAWLDKQGL